MFAKHRGEFLLVLGALFFSANGIVATVVLEHMQAFRLAQIRPISAAAILATYVLLTRPELIRIQIRQVPYFLIYGIGGFALVNFGYFLGIERGVPLALVLILEFTASIWIALWIRFVRKGFVANEMWVGIALSFIGLILISKAWSGFHFDLIGILGSLGSAFALSFYFLASEKIGGKREPIAKLIFGMGFAGLFWLVVLPPWKFPFAVFTMKMNMSGIADGIVLPGWILIAYVVLLGTVAPYMCVLSGMQSLSASTSSVIGMLEPVIAGIFAWIWFGQSWDVVQLIGATVVLVGIYLADRAKSVTA